MLQSVEGIYRNGKIDLLESPTVPEGARVIVTFLANPESSSLQNTEEVSFLEAASEFVGCLDGLPPDLSTNPKYMEGFGVE